MASKPNDAFEDERNDKDKSKFTLDEYLENLEADQMEGIIALGDANVDECTYLNGYMKRQTIFWCKTCTPEGNAGICPPCGAACHDEHEVVGLTTKRNFRCDCGNSKFGNFICKLQSKKDVENTENSYNHNFKGTCCTCDCTFPVPDDEEGEMIQCCVCEDWFHEDHLGLGSSGEIPVDDEGTPLYGEFICQACSVTCFFLTLYPESIFVGAKKEGLAIEYENHEKTPKLSDALTNKDLSGVGPLLQHFPSFSEDHKKRDVVAIDVKGKGLAYETPSGHDNFGKMEDIRDTSKYVSSERIKDQDATLCRLHVDLQLTSTVSVKNRAMFLSKNWRDMLCQCERCSSFYDQKQIRFLLDKEDSVEEYVKRAKQRKEEILQRQQKNCIDTFNSLHHVAKIELARGMSDMFSEIENFFATRDSSEDISEGEIRELFDDMKRKRPRHM